MLGPLHCGLIAQALLLPKLRSHFAEFLDNASPVGLRILSSSTCVGLRYGHHENNSGFSCLPAHADSLLLVRSDSYGGFPPADLPTGRPPYLHRCFLHRPALTRSVPTVLFHGGTGISTLTQGRSALPWKPWIFGRKDSHLPLATHSGILSSDISTAPYRYRFLVITMLPYQP